MPLSAHERRELAEIELVLGDDPVLRELSAQVAKGHGRAAPAVVPAQRSAPPVFRSATPAPAPARRSPRRARRPRWAIGPALFVVLLLAGMIAVIVGALLPATAVAMAGLVLLAVAPLPVFAVRVASRAGRRRNRRPVRSR